MFKILITGALVYFVYRFFIAPPAIDQEHSNATKTPQEQKGNNKHDDEYIDYEELD
jgi:hypothetical protein